MYSVNVTLIPGYEVKVASGNPSILAYNAQKPGEAPVVTFRSENYFVLHAGKNGQRMAVITPGGK
jgi:hypothetical protein